MEEYIDHVDKLIKKNEDWLSKRNKTVDTFVANPEIYGKADQKTMDKLTGIKDWPGDVLSEETKAKIHKRRFINNYRGGDKNFEFVCKYAEKGYMFPTNVRDQLLFFPKQACPVGFLAAKEPSSRDLQKLTTLAHRGLPRGVAPRRLRSKAMCFTVLGASYLRHSAAEWSVAAL